MYPQYYGTWKLQYLWPCNWYMQRLFPQLHTCQQSVSDVSDWPDQSRKYLFHNYHWLLTVHICWIMFVMSKWVPTIEWKMYSSQPTQFLLSLWSTEWYMSKMYKWLHPILKWTAMCVEQLPDSIIGWAHMYKMHRYLQLEWQGVQIIDRILYIILQWPMPKLRVIRLFKPIEVCAKQL